MKIPSLCFRASDTRQPSNSISKSLNKRLTEWASAAPAEKQRTLAVQRILRAHGGQASSLDLSDLKLSLLPIEPKDLPALQKLNLSDAPLERLSTAWADKLQDPARLAGKITSLDNQIEWADHLARSTDQAKMQAALSHNWQLGLRLSQLDAWAQQSYVGCKDAVWRLGLALARALALRQDVPAVAKDLLAVAPATLELIELDGLPVPRSDIDSLASGKPVPNAEERAAFDQLFRHVQDGWGANVHMAGLLKAGAHRLLRFQQLNRVAPPSLKRSVQQITEWLKSDSQAQRGLKFSLGKKDTVNEEGLNTDIAETVRHVWAYCTRHQTYRDNLMAAFANRLKDIEREKPCNTGCVQRLLQTPEGIDPEFDLGLPDENALREELTGMVSLINADLDAQIEKDAKAWEVLRQEKGSTSEAGADTQGGLKRFESTLQWRTQIVQGAIRQTLTDLRGIPTSMVDEIIVKPLEDLAQNELYLEDRTLGDLSRDYRGARGRSALLIAAERGDLESVRAQLEKGADANFVDSQGNAAIHLAAAKGQAKIVETLCAAQGIDVNQVGKDGKTPLYIAARMGHADAIKALLAAEGIAVNQAMDGGFTPLYIAARMGHADAIKALLAAEGIAVNQARDIGATPLYIAAENGHVDAIKALLAAEGIAVNQARDGGATPLYIAAQMGHVDAIKALLAAEGIAVNQARDIGATPLYIAAQMGHADAIKALLAAEGIAVNQAMDGGFTPLYIAAEKGHADAIKALLAAEGIAVNQARDSGATPLYIAAQMGHADAIKALLAAEGIAVNQAMDGGFTPLYIAARMGHADAIKALLVDARYMVR